MYRVDTNSRWWIHCSGLDYLWHIKVSRRDAYLELHTGGYAHAGRAVGSPESAVTLDEIQNGI